MKIAIVGSRSFTDYEYFLQQVSYFVQPDDIVVSGGARGADSLAERFADEFEIDKKIFPADWDRHGKSAGYLRNTQIVDYADLVIAFWDGESKGTGHTIDIAQQKGVPLIVIDVD